MTLRPGWPEDAAALTQAIAHEAVAFKLARLPWPYTAANAAEWLNRPQSPRDFTLLIMAHEGLCPRLVGAIGIHPDEGHGDIKGGHEIGYWLTPDAWGRGYATEAGHAMLGIARHAIGLRRLRSGHFIDNPASGRVLAKLGFRNTGVEMRHCLALGIDKPCAKLELDLSTEGSCEDPERMAA
ncbi:MAG: GNAT family N-acetyltransferase [Sphingomonas sp. 28-63-12]|nr:MAG: GNAT family N-acetyltransferase [Sphingomonas sp. 28-63-12]